MSDTVHNPNEPHVVDKTRAAFLNSLPKSQRTIVESAIRVATVDRDEAIASTFQRITKAEGSNAVEPLWAAAVPIAQSAADKIIGTAFETGSPHKTDALLAAFVSAHLEHGLSAFVMSRFGHSGSSGLQLATFKGAAAGAIASNIPDRIRLMRAEFERKRPNEVERVTRWALKRRAIAWPVLLYGLLSSLGGAYSLYKTLSKAAAPAVTTAPVANGPVVAPSSNP